MYPTVISFYTNTWEYPKHAERLKSECEKLGLNHHIEKLEDTGEWVHNTRLKPKFILDTLLKLKTPILWIDVDGSILKLPEELKLPTGYDIMGRHKRTEPERQWHVGTLFFDYNERVIQFLQDWVDLCRRTVGTDETALETVWQNNPNGLTFKELSETYFKVILKEHQIRPNYVIVHRVSKSESKFRYYEQNRY
jgi:hypothetical protein